MLKQKTRDLLKSVAVGTVGKKITRTATIAVLTKVVNGLRKEHDDLLSQAAEQRQRCTVLVGLWRASQLAVKFLLRVNATTREEASSAMEMCIAGLEAELGVQGLLNESVDLVSDPFRAWLPDPSQESPDLLLSSFLTPDLAVDAPSHTTLLDGSPFSMLHSALLALSRGPGWLIDLGGRSVDEARSSMVAACATSYYQQLDLLKVLDATAADLSDYQGAQRSMALNVLQQYTVCLGVSLPHLPEPQHVDVMKSLNSNNGSSSSGLNTNLGLPTDAQMEKITAALHLNKEQLDNLLKGLNFFRSLQQPLDQKQAALFAQVKELIHQGSPRAPHQAPPLFETKAAAGAAQQDPMPPIFAAAAAAAEATAAAAGGSELAGLFNGSLGLCTNSCGKEDISRIHSSRSSSRSSSSSSSCSGSGIPLPHSPSSDLSDSLGGFSPSAYRELEQLVSELKAISHRLKWLDICCMGFVLGQLTWRQLATFVVEAYPHPPVCLLWARRLVFRASIAWVPLRATGQAD
jgi:hypothetical protein